MTADSPITAEIAVRVARRAWHAVLPEATRLVRRAAAAALQAGGGSLGARPVELAVLLSDDAAVQGLNRDWRGKDRPTNVLSFPASDGAAVPAGVPVMLGDVVLALETVQAEAAEQGKTVRDHVAHLVVHGVLHLLGLDHETDTEAANMEAREVGVLATLGVADPYRAFSSRLGSEEAA